MNGNTETERWPGPHHYYSIENPRLGKMEFSVYSDCPFSPERKGFCLHQTHSNQVIPIEKVQNSERLIEGDGILISKSPSAKMEIAVKTADCLPILISGKTGAALIHAGWRGLHNNILFHDLVKGISPVEALIGPHIGPCCFEVQSDFKNYFENESQYTQKDQKLYFDLEAKAREQLSELLPLQKIHSLKFCTACSGDLNSFRKTKTDKRNWNVLILYPTQHS